MDEAALTYGGSVYAWEQFIVPPLGCDLLTGDLIRKQDAGRANVESYRLVLSPSCDMVASRGANIDKVLVARCRKYEAFLTKCGLSPTSKLDTITSKLKVSLTQAHVASLVMLPELRGLIPKMCVCLKELEQIPLGRIVPQQGKKPTYLRVTSIDSPFREQLAWAFMQVAGRPGVPERDVDAWATEIANAYHQEK
jgi:CTP synthase